jgi:tetratricopeptide (TPR) repeat protein/TolB-like protein
MLVTDLSQSPNLEVLSTERVYEILNELNRADERALSSDTVREFARRAGVKTVLVGSYLKSGEAIRISVRLQDAIEGRIVTAERVDAHGEANLFPTIDDLTRRIKAKLELPATARGDAEILTRPSTAPVAVDPIDRGLRDVTTSSVAAYRYYAEGINLHDRGRSREAIPLFEKALEIDPQFALAMVKLAVIHGNGGRIERSREYAQRAFEHADRVTTRERYYIEGYHFTRRPTTVAKGLEAYETGLKLYPDHAASRNNLAVQYLALGREDDAVPHLEDLVRRGYTYPPAYQSLANAYARRGDFERSRQLLEGFIQRYPDVAAGHAYLGNVHAMSGRFDEALGAYARAEALEPDSGPAALGRFNVHVLKGEWNEAAAVAQRGVKAADGAVRFQGHVRASLVHLYRGRSQQALASLGAATQERAALGEGGQARQRLAAVRLARNEPAVALAVFGDRREADIGPGALRLIGVAQLFLGQTTAAASTMAELKVVAQRIPSDRDVRFVHLLAGQFALHRKDTGTAVAEFAAAARSLPRYSVGPLAAAGLAQQTRFALGTAQIAAGQSEQAEQTLRQIINATTERVNAPIEYVRSLYLLATILEQRNQAAESREYYRRFLEHWRDGDLDREKVADAERKLKAQSN